MRLAEALRAAGYPDVIVAERTPEQWVPSSCGAGARPSCFLDAVEMGRRPGPSFSSTPREIVARFPQVSTHKLSLGTLARLIEAERRERVLPPRGAARVAVGHAAGLSAPVCTTLEILRTLLVEVLPVGTEPLAVCGERP